MPVVVAMMAMKPKSEQRTQNLMTFRLVMGLIVLAGVALLLAILLDAFFDSFFWEQFFARSTISTPPA